MKKKALGSEFHLKLDERTVLPLLNKLKNYVSSFVKEYSTTILMRVDCHYNYNFTK